ncbi:gasdermin-C [Heterocephalus glaber]|uniref:Gasdermin-C n=1 Tax=Heterocephalus glaber TaxID=10181 RepID=A0AAX6SEA6_HETGA|nr:gasdermin-C [Heterocephalus glaber]
MSSILERVSNRMIQNLGSKDLKPVKCVLDATKFRQFSILQKKTSFWPWKQSDDIPVEYSLMDILEPSSSVPECVRSGLFHSKDFEIKKLKTDVGINAGAEVSVSGEIVQSHGSTLEVQSVSIPHPKLETLQNRKLLEPEPSFLSVCRRRGDKLYVVTEAVELVKDTVLHDRSSANVSGKVSIPRVTYVKGKCQGEAQRVREKTVSVPQGTVLAYRKKQLVIKDKYCTILVFDDMKQKTFQYEPPRLGLCSQVMQTLESQGLFTLELSPILPIGRLEEPIGQDFRVLQKEVSKNMKALAQVSKDIQAVVFHSILAMLGDKEALKTLLDMMESDSLGHLDGPGSNILNELQQESSPPWVNLGYLIFYLLEVLLELSDTQLVLLAQSVEKRILSQQQELVRSILVPNFKYPWNIPFTLPAELLAPLQGEGLHITYALLEECGLKMELKSPRTTWHLEAKKPLSALYVALSMLLQLAKPSALPGGQSV